MRPDDEEVAYRVSRAIAKLLDRFNLEPSVGLASGLLSLAAVVALHAKVSRDGWLGLAAREWEEAEKATALANELARDKGKKS